MAGPDAKRREAALLFAWNFAAVAAIFVGRTVRDALFLVHESPANLPYLYVASPLVVAAVGFGYARLVTRVRRDRLVVGTALALAALLTAAWFGLGARWLYYALYVGVEVMSALVIMQFWVSAGERFSPREAKQVFGRIAAGGTVANIVVGLAISGVVSRTGAEPLLLVCVACLVGVAVLATVLGRAPGSARASAPPPRHAPASATPPGSGHLVVLGPMIVGMVLAVTLLDFQFKRIAAETYAGDREALVRFFGYLSAGTGVAALLLQAFVTNRLLERLGVAGALLLLPGTMGIAALALWLAPSLVTATACKASDQTLRYTVNDAGMQLLYLPVPTAVRAKKKAWLDGVVRPATEASVGAGLLAYRELVGAAVLTPIAIAAVFVTTAWVAAVVRLRAAYVRSLGETLRRRRLGDGVTSAEARRVAVALLADADPNVRAQAWSSRPPVDAAAIDAALADPSPGVRAAALALAGSAQRQRAVALTEDPAPEVARAAWLTRHRLGDPDVVSALSAALDGDTPAARRLALAVAPQLAAVELAPALVRRLADRRDARRAAAALVAIGPDAVSALAAAPLLPAAIGVLAQLDPMRGIAALGDASEASRDAAAAGLARAGLAGAALPTAPLLAAARAELVRGFTAMAAAEGLGRAESALAPDGTRARLPFSPLTIEGPAALISRALRERQERARDRLFCLLTAAAPGLDLSLVRANLREIDPARRANAVEHLDAQAWPRALREFRAPTLALIDDRTRGAKLAKVSRLLSLPQRDATAWAATLLDDEAPWMAACAAYVVGAAGLVALRPRLVTMSTDTRPLPAATATEALARLDHPERIPSMLTTTDRVLFLKGLELFAQIPGDELLDVAAVTEQLALDDGDVLFAAGERGDALYLVVTGSVRVEIEGRPVATLGPGEVVGEMALLDPAPRSANATAAGSTTLLRLAQDDFADVLAERPEVSSGVMRVLTRRLRAANRG